MKYRHYGHNLTIRHENPEYCRYQVQGYGRYIHFYQCSRKRGASGFCKQHEKMSHSFVPVPRECGADCENAQAYRKQFEARLGIKSS